MASYCFRAAMCGVTCFLVLLAATGIHVTDAQGITTTTFLSPDPTTSVALATTTSTSRAPTTTSRAPTSNTTTKAPTTTAAPPAAQMGWKAWVTVASCLVLLVALSLDVVGCSQAMIVVTVFLMLCGIITTTELFAGLANTSVVTIALLFVVVDPIAELPLVQKLISKALSGAQRTEQAEGSTEGAGSVRWPLFKIIALSLATSSFLNNAPQVALQTDLIKNYCRENGLSPSQFLMPMNFATLCGNYAIIGTSTNLIVDGLMRKYGLGPMPFFELIKINGPFTIVMVLYLVFMPQLLLSHTGGGLFRVAKQKGRDFLGQLRVLAHSSLAGVTVAEIHGKLQARHSGVELLRITRDTTDMFPLQGEEVVQAGDVLLFSMALDGDKLRSIDSVLGLEWVTVDTSRAVSRTGGAVGGGSFRLTPKEKETDAAFIPIPASSSAASTTSDTTAAAAEETSSTEPIAESTTATEPHAAAGASTEPVSVADEEMLKHSFSFGVRQRALVPVSGGHTGFYEAVIGPMNPYVGVNVGADQFQAYYNCSVLTLRVAHSGKDIFGADLAQHPFGTGDTVLLLATDTFDNHARGQEFLVINHHFRKEAIDEEKAREHGTSEEEPDASQVSYFRVPGWFPIGQPVNPKPDGTCKIKLVPVPVWYPYIAVPIFLTMVILAAIGYDLVVCAIVAAIVIVTLGLQSHSQAVAAIDLDVFIMVAFSFGIGSAMDASGFAAVLGEALKTAHVSDLKLLYLIAALSSVMTNVITNKACVQVLVPLIVRAYQIQGQNPIPPVIMCCALASMALSTPYGFATNLMVMGPGGYTARDFIKFGLPLNLMATAILPLITTAVYGLKWA